MILLSSLTTFAELSFHSKCCYRRLRLCRWVDGGCCRGGEVLQLRQLLVAVVAGLMDWLLGGLPRLWGTTWRATRCRVAVLVPGSRMWRVVLGMLRKKTFKVLYYTTMLCTQYMVILRLVETWVMKNQLDLFTLHFRA